MEVWQESLRALCDDPEEFEYESGMASFARHGRDYLLEFKSYPGVGVCVTRSDGI